MDSVPLVTLGWQITNNYLCWRFQSFGMWCYVTGLYYPKFLRLLRSEDEGTTVLWDIEICSPSNSPSQKKWIFSCFFTCILYICTCGMLHTGQLLEREVRLSLMGCAWYIHISWCWIVCICLSVVSIFVHP